jgi:hypothetical protein
MLAVGRRFLAIVRLVLCSSILAGACAKKPTEPAPSISGHVVLAPAQPGDVSATLVQLFASDPFAAGASPTEITTATGTAAEAAFLFSEVGHGAFFVVAWKDEGDGQVGVGDLRGWYDGAVDGTGNPVAKALQLVHGRSPDITITMHPVSAPNPAPSDAASRPR